MGEGRARGRSQSQLAPGLIILLGAYRGNYVKGERGEFPTVSARHKHEGFREWPGVCADTDGRRLSRLPHTDNPSSAVATYLSVCVQTLGGLPSGAVAPPPPCT